MRTRSELNFRRGPLREVAPLLVLGLAVVVAMTATVSRLADLSVLVIGQAAAAYIALAGVLAVLVAWTLPDGGFGSANRVTLLRGVLIAALAGLIGRLPADADIAWLVALTAFVAFLLDGVDGWLARRSGTATRFGARFDMELDNLLILVLAALAADLGKAGAWILLAGLLRYLFLGLRLVSGRFAAPLPPSRRRQVLCGLQVATLVACLLPVIQPPYSQLIAGLGLAGLVTSFGRDILWLLTHRLDSQGVRT